MSLQGEQGEQGEQDVRELMIRPEHREKNTASTFSQNCNFSVSVIDRTIFVSIVTSFLGTVFERVPSTSSSTLSHKILSVACVFVTEVRVME